MAIYQEGCGCKTRSCLLRKTAGAGCVVGRAWGWGDQARIPRKQGRDKRADVYVPWQSPSRHCCCCCWCLELGSTPCLPCFKKSAGAIQKRGKKEGLGASPKNAALLGGAFLCRVGVCAGMVRDGTDLVGRGVAGVLKVKRAKPSLIKASATLYAPESGQNQKSRSFLTRYHTRLSL